MILLSLLAALAAVAPHPSEVRTYQDWTVACDNGLSCEAVALLPEEVDGDWTGWVTMMLRRGGQGGDRPVLILQGFEGVPTALIADGHRVPARFDCGVDGCTILGDSDALIEMMRSRNVIDVRDAAGALLGRVSLDGASAAMLYMDERQRRLDTITAMVRRGPRPASAVPAPPVAPQVLLAARPADGPIALSPAQIAGLRRETGCTLDEVGGPDTFETEQIATGRTLVLLACGSGAYNFSSVPVIARRQGGRVTTAIAPFDSQWGIAAEGRPILTNASWDAETRRLHEYSKGRGLGDCGTRAEYAWDGASFRLVRQAEMPECRGSLYYVTTWRAEMVGR